jgi:polar amino acid transport system substrate-binding protein
MGKRRAGGGNVGANGAKSPSTMLARVDHALCRWTEFGQPPVSAMPFHRPKHAEPKGRGESDAGGQGAPHPPRSIGPRIAKHSNRRERGDGNPNTGGRDGPGDGLTARYLIGPTSQRESFMRARTLMAAALALLLTPLISHWATADTLDDIKKRGEMVIGLEAAYVPYESIQDGKIVGFDCDLGQHLADKLGVKAKFVDTEWSGIIPALYTKKFDAILSGMTITADRAQKVLFSQPYAEASNMVLARANDDTVKTAADLSGKKVGAQLGSAGAQVAQKYGDALKAQGKAGFTDIKLYEHYPEAYADLMTKRLDGVVNSMSTLMVVMQQQPGLYKQVGGIQDIKAWVGMAFRKDDTALLKFVDDEISAMKKSGELTALQKKWFSATFETPDKVPDTLP